MPPEATTMNPVPGTVPPLRLVVAPRATLGSLAAAMAVGALLAVTGLYFWGAEVAHDSAEQEAGAASSGK